VLAFRPAGLLGKPLDDGPTDLAQKFNTAPGGLARTVALFGALGLLLALTGWSGAYGQSLVTDGLILFIFGLSLQAMMALGGLVSFGHAAFFALGAYGAALAHSVWGVGLPLALAVACMLALGAAGLFGAVLVRSSGVYLAMLSLALAQVVWALASQWVGLTGGDNGVIGLTLVADETRGVFYAGLCALALFSVWGLRRLSQSPFGAALQAVRDAPVRALASGLPVGQIKYRIFVLSATVAGLAGGLFAAHKGAVFPSVASVATSLDALLVVLLGGVHQLWGVAAGSAVLVWAGAELGRGFDYWRGALGLLVMLIMVRSPSGLMGVFHRKARA
jgi:branched-chain amino acid transport system permease protein